MLLASSLLLVLSLSALAADGPGAAQSQRAALAARPLDGAETARPALDGSLSAARARALATHPELRRAHAAWAAAVHRIAGSARIPDPSLSVGVFVRAVETRVGPQQARLSIQQALPWPATLTGQAAAAAARAEAAGAVLDATALSIGAQVEQAYWALWELRAARAAHVDHGVILAGLSTTVAARVETGAVPLAALQQVDLARARLADRIASLDARERGLEARLAALVDAAPGGGLETGDAPPAAAVPALSVDALHRAFADHPELQAATAGERAAQARLRVARTQVRPGLQVGADWILTGPADDPSMEGSGKDALAVGLGLRVPVAWRAIKGDIAAAEVELAGAAAAVEIRQRDHASTLAVAVAAVEDAARRIGLTRDTLLPQAEAAYASLLGAFVAGRVPVADLLLAQRDLLDLRLQQDALRAAHAQAWATLDALCARPPLRRRL